MDELFTFIMDFRGGTYIDQVHAPDLDAAIRKWAKELKLSEIEHLTKRFKDEIIKDIEDKDETPIAINTTINVWIMCFSIHARHLDVFATIHIIKTATNPQRV